MDYIDEGAKIKEVVDKGKKQFIKLGDSYNNSLNRRAEYIAGKLVKKPAEDAPQHIYDKYKRDMIRWKSTYKVGEILAVGTVAIGPIDWVIKGATINAMRTSSDPVDKAVMSKLNKISVKGVELKNKMSKFKEKLKNKPMKKDDVDKEISTLDSMASNLAKQMDVVNSGSQTTSSVSESSVLSEMIDSLLYENGEITLESYEAVRRFIERSDYTNEENILIAETCLDILNEYNDK